jgi:carbonic anhydrase
MSAGFEDLLAGNEAYAATYTGASLPGRAARGLALVTCMDSRLDPLAMLGLAPGDAKVLRNPGGQVTDDVLVALVLATHLLGVDRVLVAQHTDCRMAKVTDEQAHEVILEQSGVDTRTLRLGTISDQRLALQRDVQRVRSSPYLAAGVAVAGGLYDVQTGRLSIVVPDGG